MDLVALGKAATTENDATVVQGNLSYSLPSDIGTNKVITATATDAAENTQSCQFSVTIKGKHPVLDSNNSCISRSLYLFTEIESTEELYKGVLGSGH